MSISVRASREALPTVPKPTRESNLLMLVFTVFVVVEDFLEIPVAQLAKGLSSARNCLARRCGWAARASSTTIIQNEMGLKGMMEKYLEAAESSPHSLGTAVERDADAKGLSVVVQSSQDTSELLPRPV